MSEPFLVTANGGSEFSRAQARRREFELTSRGVRLPTADTTVDRARWLAAQLPLRPESVLSHSTAAQLYRAPLPLSLQTTLPVHVTTPRDVPRPRRRDIVTHHASLPDSDVTTLAEFRLTTPERTYVDMASLLGFDHLVALGDVLLRDHGASSDSLLHVAEARRSYPGRRSAVNAVGWLDSGAASPRESHLRVLLRRGRLPRPEVNGVITDEHGGFLAVGDLVFRRERVIVEYDGAVHAPMRQRAKDASRRALLREHGWIVVEVVGEDMHYPQRVLARVRAALRDGMDRLV
jgi:very-short-patch-repair endonuclease